MIKILRPDYELLLIENECCLKSRKYADVYFPIHQFEAFVLSLHDGAKDDLEIAKISKYIFGGKIANYDDWYKELNNLYRQFLVPISKAQALFQSVYNPHDSSDILSLKVKKNRVSRLKAPRYIGVYLTDSCARNCRYCYANTENTCSNNKETSIKLSDYKNLIYQAFELGVGKFLLTGGEPFCHSDSYELIKYITSLHITVQILTKARVEVKQFINIDKGLLELGFSIDSHNEDIANYLAGSDTFYNDIISNIHDMRLHNIPYQISIVITSANVDSLVETIDYFIEQGASRISTGHYVCSNLEHQDNSLLLADVEKEKADTLINNLLSKNPYKEVLKHKPHQSTMGENEDVQAIRCSTGHTRLNIRYDGKFICCEKLTDALEFDFGNILDRRILEVWNSPELQAFMFPSRELYNGTVCEKCSDFDACTGKNHCYWLSYIMYGKYYRATKEVENVCVKRQSMLGIQ